MSEVNISKYIKLMAACPGACYSKPHTLSLQQQQQQQLPLSTSPTPLFLEYGFSQAPLGGPDH